MPSATDSGLAWHIVPRRGPVADWAGRAAGPADAGRAGRRDGQLGRPPVHRLFHDHARNAI